LRLQTIATFLDIEDHPTLNGIVSEIQIQEQSKIFSIKRDVAKTDCSSVHADVNLRYQSGMASLSSNLRFPEETTFKSDGTVPRRKRLSFISQLLSIR